MSLFVLYCIYIHFSTITIALHVQTFASYKDIMAGLCVDRLKIQCLCNTCRCVDVKLYLRVVSMKVYSYPASSCEILSHLESSTLNSQLKQNILNNITHTCRRKTHITVTKERNCKKKQFPNSLTQNS